MATASDERLLSLLSKWSTSSLSEESDTNTKMLHLDQTEAPRQQDGLRALRKSLDTAGRAAKADEYKALANAQFKQGHWRIALVGYLAGVWMLRRDTADPPCPKLLANHLTEVDAAISALGPPKVEDISDDVSDDEGVVSELRETLLVNLAAAALKLNEWRLARTACERVLESCPVHAKALWRLAKAHEGDSNLTDAISAASELVKCDASNKDAVKLLETLQTRKKKKGKMFHGFVERAQAEGDDLYTKKEHEADIDKAMHKGFLSAMARNPDGTEYGGKNQKKIEKDEEDEEDEKEPETLGEAWEKGAREHAMWKAQNPKSNDEHALDRVMGKAYRTVRAQREEGVRRTLPPDVLKSAAYVDP